jgi:carbamoyl-phosphate synthase large subunit
MSAGKINVLVTAVGGGGPGEQLLKALLLVRERYRIVGADTSSICPQFAWCDEAVTIPMASDPNYLPALNRVLAHHRIQAVFFGCEPEIKTMMHRQKELNERGVIAPMNPPEVVSLCMDKDRCTTWLSDKGFRTPKSRRLEDVDDYGQIDFYPVVIKPAVGSGGSRNVYIAQDVYELQQLGRFLLRHGDKFLVQEYVGSPDHEYTVGVLHDMNGQYINTITIRRHITGLLNIRLTVPNRSGRTDLGASLVVSSGVSQGDVVHIPIISDTCRAIAAALGAKSAINVQCRLVNNQVYVFEINPRFSGTTSIRAMVGYNEPDVLLRKHLAGETIKEDFSYGTGTVLRGLTEYLISQNEVPNWRDLEG